ncbi:MAG: cupin domain-containing protein [Nocardioidaceae bacterium]
MGDGQGPSDRQPEVAVIRPDQRDTNTGQTPGLQRFEAISSRLVRSQKLWMGYTVLGAGGRTGVHHHGESETALYVVSGVGRWWVGDRLDQAQEARAGDFVLIPPNVIHWEENGSDEEPCVMIVARSTQDAIVVNLPDHPHGPAPVETT